MDERIYGLLGRKLGHSWSVPIHAALGNGAYRLLELEPDGLAPFLHRKDIGGLNVTIPYKRDVMPLCDEIDPAAEAIGSVNTIVRCADGKLVGYNTDIDVIGHQSEYNRCIFYNRKKFPLPHLHYLLITISITKIAGKRAPSHNTVLSRTECQ